MKPLSKPVKIKGDPKKDKLAQSDNSTKQVFSYFEHADTQFSDSPTSKS